MFTKGWVINNMNQIPLLLQSDCKQNNPHINKTPSDTGFGVERQIDLVYTLKAVCDIS